MARLAILAGAGVLPYGIAEEHPDALFVDFSGGIPMGIATNERIGASFEKFGELIDSLKDAGVTELVFAGGMERPTLDPDRFDSKMQVLAPRLQEAMWLGDDGLLRTVADIFEQEGFGIRGAHELIDGLTAEPGLLFGPEPSAADRFDAERAHRVISALGDLDVGQGVVVAGGQVLAIETLLGTDSMLRSLADFPESARRSRGVLVKRPKPNQDLRFDMPAIGPGTATAAATAGLAGIFIEPGNVILLERERTFGVLEYSDMFLCAETF